MIIIMRFKFSEKLRPILKLTLVFVAYIFTSLPAFAISNGDGDKAYINKDFETAFKNYKLAADFGDAHSQVMLGNMYHSKTGGMTNHADAFKYYVLSSRQGNEVGKINLAVAYAIGMGTIKSKKNAMETLLTLGNNDIELDVGTTNKNQLLNLLQKDLLTSFYTPHIAGSEYKEIEEKSEQATKSGLTPSSNPITTENKISETASTQCSELGFKQKTKQFSKCLLTLQPKTAAPSKESQKGDGSADDLTCQKYGFKVAEESYKKCRLDLKIAEDDAQTKIAQYELQKRAYEEQVRQYEEQRAVMEERIREAQAEKDRQDNINLITFGLGLASGRTLREAAPALNGQTMYSRGYFNSPPQPPTEPIFNNIQLITPRGTANCNYNSLFRELRCN